MKYLILVPETRMLRYVVEADNEDQATGIVAEGDGECIGEDPDSVLDMDTNNWIVEKQDG